MISTAYKFKWHGPRVRRALRKGGKGAFFKAGAFIMRAARSSIGKRKRVSEPGSPPSSHKGTLKSLILFDATARGVIVGPEKFEGVVRGGATPVVSTVPNVLETGGTVRVLEVYVGNDKRFAGRTTPDGWFRTRSAKMLRSRPSRVRIIKIAARPFMAPALKKGVDDLPRSFRDVVRG